MAAKQEMSIAALFDLSRTSANSYLAQFTYPWEALSGISEFVIAYGNTCSAEDYKLPEETGIPNVWIARDAKVAPTAFIQGPCVIESEAEIRHCAYIRGSALIGKGAVVGNSCEVKNSILFEGVQVPHFNYVGDSILGYKAHLGAGAVTSNIKSDKTNISISAGSDRIETGRRKFGAAVGDLTEVGCNSVLCPGTVLGKECTVYPLSRVRGFIPQRHIFKDATNVVAKV